MPVGDPDPDLRFSDATGFYRDALPPLAQWPHYPWQCPAAYDAAVERQDLIEKAVKAVLSAPAMRLALRHLSGVSKCPACVRRLQVIRAEFRRLVEAKGGQVDGQG